MAITPFVGRFCETASRLTETACNASRCVSRLPIATALWQPPQQTIPAMPDESGFEYDVFLSHSAKDEVVVRDVAERLRKDGADSKAEGGRRKFRFILHPSSFAHALARAGVLHVGTCVRLGTGAVGVRDVPLSRPAKEGAPLPSLRLDNARIKCSQLVGNQTEKRPESS